MDKKRLLPLLSAILLYFFANPYFVWNLWDTTYGRIILTGVLSLIFTLSIGIKENGRVRLFILLLLLLAYTAYTNGSNLIGFVASVITCVLPFSKESYARSTLDYFVTIYAVVIATSGVIFILSLLNFAPVIGTLEPLNELKTYKYTLYPLLVVPDVESLRFRFCGPFDEPGVVGTISAIILTIYKFNLKDKRILAIFITGFFSLSFFYYVIIGVYYTINNVVVAKNKKGGFILLLLVAFVILTFDNTYLYDTLWSRFAWDSDTGKIAGDNRLGELGMGMFLSIIGTKEFFFGVENFELFEEMVMGSASFISVIMRYGVIFSGLYVYLFTSYAWKYKSDTISYILFLFVFLGTIYQRPFIFDPIYLFLFSMLAVSCGDKLYSVS